MAGNPQYDALLSTTIKNYRSKFADNLSQSFLLYWWLTSRERKSYQDGGESIVIQLMYGKNSTVKTYDGYELLDTTPQEGLTAAQIPWKQLSGTISISRKEERQNSGKHRIISLLKSKVRQLEISMADEMNRQFLGDGTGNNSKDFFGLDLIIENGSAWGSFGGIDRNAADNAWWRNQWIGAVGAFATNGVSNMRRMYNLCSRGNEHPDLILTTMAIHEAYELTLVANQRFENARVADGNFEMLKFKGALVGFDEMIGAGIMFFLSSGYLEFIVDKESDLITTDFVRPVDQDAMSAQMLTMGNLGASNCARLGRLDGITTP